MSNTSRIPTCNDFLYKGQKLEIVNSYKYLGMIVSNTCNINRMIEDRISKANRAAFVIRQALSVGSNVSVGLAESLFDKKISPILTYGCTIWGVPQVRNVVKLQVNQLPTGDKKDFVLNHLNCLGCNISKEDVASVRTYVKNNEITVDLYDPVLRNRIAMLAKKTPVSFNVFVWDDNKNVSYDMVHTKYCKFMLGVSKYESTTLVLGELGRYPVQQKVIRQTILFWHRLEMGTDNLLLQNAYLECKNNSHDWLNNIYHFLHKNGLGHIWDNISGLNENYLKSNIDQRLQDQYMQKYFSYVNDNLENGKSEIVNLCSDSNEYSKRGYLDIVTSPSVRSTITKLRIDANNLNDCRFRHYRKKSDTSMCTYCGIQETVKHRLLKCSKGDLEHIRETFENKCLKFFTDWGAKTPNDKLGIILNVNHWSLKEKDRSAMADIICNFLKKAYDIN